MTSVIEASVGKKEGKAGGKDDDEEVQVDTFRVIGIRRQPGECLVGQSAPAFQEGSTLFTEEFPPDLIRTAFFHFLPSWLLFGWWFLLASTWQKPVKTEQGSSSPLATLVSSCLLCCYALFCCSFMLHMSWMHPEGTTILWEIIVSKSW